MSAMMRKINFRLAVNGMLGLFSCTLVFHFLILGEVIPFTIVWGGRLESLSQMRVFEGVSIVMTLVIMLVVGAKGRYLGTFWPDKLLNVILWGLAGLFVLNTVGNIFSESTLEAILFTPVTILAAVFCVRIAMGE